MVLIGSVFDWGDAVVLIGSVLDWGDALLSISSWVSLVSLVLILTWEA